MKVVDREITPFDDPPNMWYVQMTLLGKLYICETTLIDTTFAFDNLVRVLAVFPKMKGFYTKAQTIKVYWNRPDFALADHVWQRHVVVVSHSGRL